MIFFLALFVCKAVSRRNPYSVGHGFIDDFSHFNGSLWKAEHHTYRCVDESRMPLSCAISEVGNIEFVNISLPSNPYFNTRNGMNIWLQNDCENHEYGSKCCPKNHPCTRFSTGQLTSRKTYGHGTFSFLAKPVPKPEKRSGMIQMDVFFVRHGVSMANHIRQLAVQKGSITLLSGESILAIQLETGCNTGNLPSGVTQADCDHFLTDAKLSPEGVAQANSLQMNFGFWAKPSDNERYGMRSIPYDPRDALVVISPMRRAAMTILTAFRDHIEELCIEVDFDFRELQYSLRYGIHPENKLASYPHALQQYFAENGFKDPNVNYRERIYEQIKGKVMDSWEDDGCPKDPNIFKKKMQHITSVAYAQGKKYVVIGTHGFTIKCINRVFHMQQTGGMHDETNPFFKFGWHVVQNGAVERITWDLFHEAVVGVPRFTYKGWHVYATNQAVNWKMFNSQWPMPARLPATANGMYGPENEDAEEEVSTEMPSLDYTWYAW